jgi:hypothetical protein
MRADNRKPWGAVDDRGGKGLWEPFGAARRNKAWAWRTLTFWAVSGDAGARRPPWAGRNFAALGPTVRAFVSAIGHSCQAQ